MARRKKTRTEFTAIDGTPMAVTTRIGQDGWMEVEVWQVTEDKENYGPIMGVSYSPTEMHCKE